jgi:hypothetical protein
MIKWKETIGIADEQYSSSYYVNELRKNQIEENRFVLPTGEEKKTLQSMMLKEYNQIIHDDNDDEEEDKKLNIHSSTIMEGLNHS